VVSRYGAEVRARLSVPAHSLGCPGLDGSPTGALPSQVVYPAASKKRWAITAAAVSWLTGDLAPHAASEVDASFARLRPSLFLARRMDMALANFGQPVYGAQLV
jgi:hypothetical protein